MEGIEKQLNEILRLKQEQDKVILLRIEVPKLYERLLEKEANIYFEKLLKAKINLTEAELQLPSFINKFETSDFQVEPNTPFQNISQKTDNFFKCLQFVNSRSSSADDTVE